MEPQEPISISAGIWLVWPSSVLLWIVPVAVWYELHTIYRKIISQIASFFPYILSTLSSTGLHFEEASGNFQCSFALEISLGLFLTQSLYLSSKCLKLQARKSKIMALVGSELSEVYSLLQRWCVRYLISQIQTPCFHMWENRAKGDKVSHANTFIRMANPVHEWEPCLHDSTTS